MNDYAPALKVADAVVRGAGWLRDVMSFLEHRFPNAPQPTILDIVNGHARALVPACATFLATLDQAALAHVRRHWRGSRSITSSPRCVGRSWDLPSTDAS